MRLYHHPFSFNARRAVMTALHLSVPVELVVVDMAAREHLTPQFLRLNPNHKVPVLQDQDFCLWESCAIMQYLADKTPGQRVYPVEIRARADVNRWLFWCSQHFSPAAAILNWEHAVKRTLGLGAADPAEVQRGEQLFGALAAILDEHLAGRPYICGAELTLADLAIAAPLGHAVPARLPLEPYTHVRRWLGHLEPLDAWQRTALHAR